MIGKIFKNGNEWRRAELTKQELDKVLDNLIKHNMKEYERCHAVTKNKELADALFKKQGLVAVSAINGALEEKVFKLKQGTGPCSRISNKRSLGRKSI